MRTQDNDQPIKIFGWPGDRGGCGFYRIRLPLWTLKRQGHNTVWSPKFSRDETIEGYAGITAVLAQRVAEPEASDAFRRECERGDLLMVYEVDDDLWTVDQSNPVHDVYADRDRRARIAANLRAAHRVTTTTDYLANRILEVAPRADVRVIPNTLPAEVLSWPAAGGGEQVVFGWAGGDSHAIDWKTIIKPLRQFLWDNPQVRLHTIGADFASRLVAGMRGQHRHRTWLPDVPQYWQAVDFDVALAPLARHPFNRSKSPLRPLEMAFRGVPVIASRFGPYATFVRHGVTGLRVRTEKEWRQAMQLLAHDTAARAEMSAAAREHAADYTTERWAGEWLKALTR